MAVESVGENAEVLIEYERRLAGLENALAAAQALDADLSARLALAERELAALRAELAERKRTQQALAMQATEAERLVQDLRAQLRYWEGRWAQLESGIGWPLLLKLQVWRSRLAPPASRRERWLEDARHALSPRREAPGRALDVGRAQQRPDVKAHNAAVDIIICVHDALPAVQRCLASLLEHTAAPFRLILVDDGSAAETRDYLQQVARQSETLLLRNEEAQGYTKAANQGLRHAAGRYSVMLNSDTIVTAGWLDRLIACMESDARIGLAGPLSNTASWQSIPEVEEQGDWAANLLPEKMTVPDVGQMIAASSARLYPQLPFLNGFCLMVRRPLLSDIGYFDESSFPEGYGEENDYCLRTRAAGWRTVLADDVYVYHAEAQSYTNQRRKRLSQQADAALAHKHGQEIINQGTIVCRHDRVIEGIRAHARPLADRQEYIRRGKTAFSGKRVLFLLPAASVGGGANLVILAARVMNQMGANAHIFNLKENRERFDRAYPQPGIKVIYDEVDGISGLTAAYDAVVATANASVTWLLPASEDRPGPVKGYFIQDYEPSFYPVESTGYRLARASYSLVPGMVRVATTAWLREELQAREDVTCISIGPYFDLDLFRPRPRRDPDWPERPLRVAAMIRPGSTCRAPSVTMRVLRQVARRHGSSVEIWLFGTSADNPVICRSCRRFSMAHGRRTGHEPDGMAAQRDRRICGFFDVSGARPDRAGGDGLWGCGDRAGTGRSEQLCPRRRKLSRRRYEL